MIENRFEELCSNAQMAFINGRYDNTVNICREAIQLEADVAEVFTLAGNACLVQNRMQEAEEFFRRAVELDIHTGERYFDLANSLFGQQRLSDALENYAKAVQLGCRDEVMQKIYYLMGVINQVEQKDYKDALLNFERAEKMHGENSDRADILLKRIQIYVEQHRYEKAENCAVQLKLLVPGEFQSYQLLYQLYLEQKKTKKADEILKEAEENIVLDTKIKIEIAFDRIMLCCFLAEQNPAEMDKYYEEALNQLMVLDKSGLLSEKDKCEVLITGSEIYMKLLQYDKAIEWAAEAVSHTGKELTEYFERGYYILLVCADKRKDYIGIRKYAQKLKKSENIFYRNHCYYSEAYAVKKMSEENPLLREECVRLYNLAIAYYRNAAVTEPGDFLAYLYRAKCYVDMGKYDKAAEIGKLLPEDAQKLLQDYISGEQLQEAAYNAKRDNQI